MPSSDYTESPPPPRKSSRQRDMIQENQLNHKKYRQPQPQHRKHPDIHQITGNHNYKNNNTENAYQINV